MSCLVLHVLRMPASSITKMLFNSFSACLASQIRFSYLLSILTVSCINNHNYYHIQLLGILRQLLPKCTLFSSHKMLFAVVVQDPNTMFFLGKVTHRVLCTFHYTSFWLQMFCVLNINYSYRTEKLIILVIYVLCFEWLSWHQTAKLRVLVSATSTGYRNHVMSSGV